MNGNGLQPDLVAIDESRASARAVDVAVAEARRDGRSLVFVHVTEASDRQDVSIASGSLINHALQTSASAGVPGEIQMRQGRPREQIIATIDTLKPRFVYVGTNGRQGIEDFVLGSVAAAIVRHSKSPVVVVPAISFGKPGESVFSRLFVAIDFEAAEVSPTQPALAFASGTLRSILFCAVVDEIALLTLAAEADGGLVVDGLIPSAHKAAVRAIDDAIERARQADIPSEALVVVGHPAQTICKTAVAHGATAIVMGTHGREGLARFFLGSTTQGVVRESRIPVIVFHPDHQRLTMAAPMSNESK